MKKNILFTAILVMIMIALCGCAKTNSIVGKWESDEPNKIINYEFTSDNRVILDRCNDEGIWEHLECNYELKNGRLLRSAYSNVDPCTAHDEDTEENPNQIPVIYTIDGNTLILEAISHLGKAQFSKVDTFTYPNPNPN